MRGYLLDTHILLWWLAEPDRVADAARQVIRDAANPIFVSAAAAWEIAIKTSIGRLQTPSNLLEVLRQEQMSVLPIDAAHALAVADLPMHHHDPFDRLQIAQARLEQLTLVTHDQRIRLYDVPLLCA